jgi:hypothetical protein
MMIQVPTGESQAGLGAERSGRRSAIFEPIESDYVVTEISHAYWIFNHSSYGCR